LNLELGNVGEPKTGMKQKLFRFQDLELWKQAIAIGEKLLDIGAELETKKPYRFTEQVRGAGLSISSNPTKTLRSLRKLSFGHVCK
jgi:hypothetical protein